jgi:hypothetical protein
VPGLGPDLRCSVSLLQTDEDEGEHPLQPWSKVGIDPGKRQGEMGQKQWEKLVEFLVVLCCRLFSLGAFPPGLRGATSP